MITVRTLNAVPELLEPPPEPTARDKITAITLAAAGEVPFAGTLVEVLRQTFGTAYENRQRAAQQMLYAAIVELQARSIDLDALVNRPAFVSAVHEACRIALGQHLEAKLEMLQSVLINHALRSDDRSGDIEVLRYLRLVERLEPEHVAALRSCHPVGTIRDSYEIDPPSTEATSSLEPDGLRLLVGELDTQLLAEVRALGRRYQPADRLPENYIVTDHGDRFLRWLTVI